MEVARPDHRRHNYRNLKCPVIRMSVGIMEQLNLEFHRTLLKNPENWRLPAPLFPTFLVESIDEGKGVLGILADYVTPEQLYILLFVNGKKYYDVYLDISQLHPGATDYEYEVRIISEQYQRWYNQDPEANKKRTTDDIHNEIFTVLAVEDYMLNFSPELEFLPPRKESDISKAERERYPDRRRELILRSKKKVYTIEKIVKRREAEYKLPSWYRKGHYRKYKNGKVVYVVPTIAHRKGLKEKEPEGKTYIIKE